jgi:hypothetical protein
MRDSQLLAIALQTVLSSADSNTVKAQVFFGGEPWMLQCADENVTIGAGFLGASKRMSVTSSSKVNFGTIDCNGKLPSNKTFWQRFGQTPKVRPQKNLFTRMYKTVYSHLIILAYDADAHIA